MRIIGKFSRSKTRQASNVAKTMEIINVIRTRADGTIAENHAYVDAHKWDALRKFQELTRDARIAMSLAEGDAGVEAGFLALPQGGSVSISQTSITLPPVETPEIKTFINAQTLDGDLITFRATGMTRDEAVIDLLDIINDDVIDGHGTNDKDVDRIVAEAKKTFDEKDVFVHETTEYAIIEVTIPKSIA
jgi:hypothetical protein